MISKNNLPPQIKEHFNSSLLSSPRPRFCEDSKTLWDIYQYIIQKLKPKWSKNLVWLVKFERLEKQFLELYERAKAKEKDIKEKTGNPARKPFDMFREINRYRPRLYSGLKFKSTLFNIFK